ncbi:MAG: FAD-dependent monooxygenase [Anaerolineae bacterium]|nr:FAD-dependent monooxygenase [Anaerolineae bacterium]
MSHAVVIGSSLSGLLAARVLSDYVDQVTVLERDELPEQAEYRGSVPQARHLHVLLAKGREILTQLFPRFEADFAALGIATIDIGLDTSAFTAGGWTKRVRAGVLSNPVSRVTIDWYVYSQLRQHPNVTFLSRREVQRLVTDADRRIVTGVEVLNREDQSTQTLAADLVIDASGRTSKTPQWLQDLGYDAPPRTVVNSYLGYATRWFQMPAGQTFDWHILLITALPTKGNFRGGAIQRIEGDRWVVTLGGVNKTYPPTDDDGFLEFARQLPSTAIYEIIKDAEPISPVYGYRRTENIWNHYERLSRHPEHLLVMGDAYCGFNPIYGQGMSVAAMEAQKLDELLRQYGPAGLSPAVFYGVLAKIIANPWLLATGEDLRYPGTEGDRPGWLARMAQKYVDRVIAVLPLDEVVGTAFIKVNNLMEPPQVLFRPDIIARVLGYTLRGVRQDESLNAPVQPMKPAVGD